MTDLKKLSDPDSFGPGAWLVIHTLAFDAITNDKKKCFEETMKVIQRGLKCEMCKIHCGKYLKKHPMRDYWNVLDRKGKDIGMFKWTWAFHNAVNTRLGKPVMDWDTAYHLYSDSKDTVCTKDCGDEASHSPKTPHHHHHRSSTSHHSVHMRDLSNRQPGLVRFIPTRNILRPYNYR